FGPCDHAFVAGLKITVAPLGDGDTGATITRPSASNIDSASLKLPKLCAGSVVQVLVSGLNISPVLLPVPYSPPATNTRPSWSTCEASYSRVYCIDARRVQMPLL